MRVAEGIAVQGLRGSYRLHKPLSTKAYIAFARATPASGPFSDDVGVLLYSGVSEGAMEAIEMGLAQKLEAMRFMDPTHIVQIVDFGHQEDTFFVVFDQHTDMTLERYLAVRGSLEVEQAVSITRQLALGLQDMIETGIVEAHYNLTPASVLVFPDGIVKIMGAGIVQSLLEADQPVMRYLNPAYIAPELLNVEENEDRADVRSDLYALGCMLFELLEKRLPYAGSPGELPMMHLQEPLPQIVRVDAAPRLQTILERCMAKWPQERFGTPMTLADALGRLYDEHGDPTQAQPEPVPPAPQPQAAPPPPSAPPPVVEPPPPATPHPMAPRERTVDGRATIYPATPDPAPTPSPSVVTAIPIASIPQQQLPVPVGPVVVTSPPLNENLQGIQEHLYILESEVSKLRVQVAAGGLALPPPARRRTGWIRNFIIGGLLVAGLLVILSLPGRGAATLPDNVATTDQVEGLNTEVEGLSSQVETLNTQITEQNLLQAETYTNLGWLYRQNENHEAALNTFRLALQNNPNQPKAREGLGWTYYSLEQYAEAIPEFEEAFRLDPTNTNTYNGIGYSYVGLGDCEQALAAFEQVLTSSDDEGLIAVAEEGIAACE